MILATDCHRRLRLQLAWHAARGFPWFLVFLFAGLALFAHGCHLRDVDHELLAPGSIQGALP